MNQQKKYVHYSEESCDECSKFLKKDAFISSSDQKLNGRGEVQVMGKAGSDIQWGVKKNPFRGHGPQRRAGARKRPEGEKTATGEAKGPARRSREVTARNKLQGKKTGTS